MRVSDLKIGQSARIAALPKGFSPYKQRLIVMGLLPGTVFTVTHMAPLGDPIEISVRGYALSLRKHEANILEIEYSPDE